MEIINKFLMLTDMENRKTVVNSGSITYLYTKPSGDTCIQMDKGYLHVKETVIEIYTMLVPDLTK